MSITATMTPLRALDQWAPIVWLKTNVYAYPTLEVMHIVGIAMVFGTLWIVDLRLLLRIDALDKLDVIAETLKNRLRECLGRRTANEVWVEMMYEA